MVGHKKLTVGTKGGGCRSSLLREKVGVGFGGVWFLDCPRKNVQSTNGPNWKEGKKPEPSSPTRVGGCVVWGGVWGVVVLVWGCFWLGFAPPPTPKTKQKHPNTPNPQTNTPPPKHTKTPQTPPPPGESEVGTRT